MISILYAQRMKSGKALGNMTKVSICRWFELETQTAYSCHFDVGSLLVDDEATIVGVASGFVLGQVITQMGKTANIQWYYGSNNYSIFSFAKVRVSIPFESMGCNENAWKIAVSLGFLHRNYNHF